MLETQTILLNQFYLLRTMIKRNLVTKITEQVSKFMGLNSRFRFMVLNITAYGAYCLQHLGIKGQCYRFRPILR